MESVKQGENALGEYILLSFDKELYYPEAIMKTCYEFTDMYFIHAVKIESNTTGIYFYEKESNIKKANIINDVKTFLELLNDNQMRQVIYLETATIHKDIVRKAFSPAATLIDNGCQ